MTETGTYNRTDEQGIKQRIEETFLDLFGSEKPSENKPSQYETGNEQNGVPSQLEISDGENFTRHIPVYIHQIYHFPIDLGSKGNKNE